MELFFYSVAFTLLLFGGMVMAFKSGWLKSDRSSRGQDSLLKEMQSLRQEVEWLKRDRTKLMEDLIDAQRKIEELQGSERRLLNELAQVRAALALQNTQRVRILGIWPQRALNTEGERDAIDAVGFDYLPLVGEMATRENVLRELRLDGFTIIEIGAHGDDKGIRVHNDDVLDAGFWTGALNRRTIRVAILLACYSDISIADAFRRAGVQHVIAAQAEIRDEDAVRFTRTFYQAYADGLEVPQAFREARLVLPVREREKLVLR